MVVLALPLESVVTVPTVKQEYVTDVSTSAAGQNCTVNVVLAVAPVSCTVTVPEVSMEICPALSSSGAWYWALGVPEAAVVKVAVKGAAMAFPLELATDVTVTV